MSCSVGHRCGSDLVLLWLWRRPAATGRIRPLAWEPPSAAEAAQDMAKRHPQKKKRRRRNAVLIHATTWMNLKNILLSERSQTKKATDCMNVYEIFIIDEPIET